MYWRGGLKGNNRLVEGRGFVPFPLLVVTGGGGDSRKRV